MGNFLGIASKENLFQILIKSEIKIPPDNHIFDVSPGYFSTIWREKFSSVYCEGDGPECPECVRFDKEISKLQVNDPVCKTLVKEKLQHLKKIDIQYNYSVKLQQHVHTHAYNYLLIYKDYKRKLKLLKFISQNLAIENKQLLIIQYSDLLLNN